MGKKLPPDAFNFYVSLGQERSYGKVAAHYEVDKRTVCRRARDESWQGELLKLEAEAKEKGRQKLVDELDEVNERHRKMLRAVAGRAVEGLRSYPVRNAKEAIQAAEMVIKLERLIYGESTERSELSVQEIIRRETQELLAVSVVEGDEADLELD